MAITRAPRHHLKGGLASQRTFLDRASTLFDTRVAWLMVFLSLPSHRKTERNGEHRHTAPASLFSCCDALEATTRGAEDLGYEKREDGADNACSLG